MASTQDWAPVILKKGRSLNKPKTAVGTVQIFARVLRLTYF